MHWLICRGLILVGAFLAMPVGVGAESLTIEVRQPDSVQAGNQVPARVAIDFRQVLNDEAGHINPQSLKLYAIDEDGNRIGKSVPLRFDDPDPRPKSFHWGFIGGGGQSGDLVFVHTTTDQSVVRYQLIYERWDKTQGTVPPSPTPQIGDYDILRYEEGGPMSGLFHTKIGICDWYSDGSLCILAGDTLGRVTVYRRQPGTLDQFDVPIHLQIDGEPLQLSWMVSPEAVDWDGDGLLDLIIGDESAGIFLVKNIGEPGKPKLAAPIPIVDADGTVIKSPVTPIAEKGASAFVKDYMPAPLLYDYNGDGVKDLVFGGYVTGQIFWYENTAKADEPHRFVSRGAIMGENDEPVDATWGAAPYFADLDGDGMDELISGHIAEDKVQFGWHAHPSLFFWKNAGTREKPVWKRADVAFPMDWTEYPPDVTVPRVVDWNGDGLLDIVMSGRSEVFWFENVGSAREPRFEYHQQFTMRNGPLLLCPRFNAISPWLGDLDGDGLPDLIRGGSGDIAWASMKQFENTPRFEDRGFLSVDGKPIYHEFRFGDDTTFPILHDMDGDGLLDLLVGDGDGYLTLYRNIGTPSAHKFAPGEYLRQEDGSLLCVGEPLPDEVFDFEGISGKRSVPAAGDFVGDGGVHLVCSNASGEIYFYRRLADGRYATGQLIDTKSGRVFVCAADWNHDGRLDLLLTAQGVVWIYLNQGTDEHGAPVFTSSKVENIPWLPYPRPLAMDWNRDGDLDLLLASSYGLLHFAERDFIENGYIEATLVTSN